MKPENPDPYFIKGKLCGEQENPKDLLQPLERFSFELYRDYLNECMASGNWAKRLDFQDWLHTEKEPVHEMSFNERLQIMMRARQ